MSKTPIKLTEFSGISQLISWPGGLTLAGLKNGEVYRVIFNSTAGPAPNSNTAKMPGGNNFKKLFVGGGNSGGICAINTLKQLYCWPGGSAMDAKLIAQNVESLYSSDTHSCAVTSNKKLICFGSDNQHGELALGDTALHEQLIESPLFSNVQNVLLGSNYTCVSEGGPMKCVGVRPYLDYSANSVLLLKAK